MWAQRLPSFLSRVDPGVTRGPVRPVRWGWSRRPTVTRARRTRTPTQQLTDARPRRPKLASPPAGCAAVGARHLVGAVADRVSQFDENLVQCGGRLMPLQLLYLVGSGCLPGPLLLQWHDLRPQLLERGVQTRGGGVNLLANGVFERGKVVRQH